MNIKHLLPLFAAGAFLFASCTEENEVSGGTTTDGTGTGDDADRQEVLVSLKNQLVLQKPETKAEGDPIATEEENYIHSLDVYVFGSKEENGDYTLQEIHYYRDDASTVTIPGVETYSFNLTNSADNSGITTGLLKLNKGLFVRLYCVANRTEMYTTSADGTVSKYTDFKSLVQTAPGQDNNLITAGTPKEADFKKLHIKLIDPAAIADPTENDILASPLPMSGAYTTPLDLTDFGSSARTQIGFKLSRMVARFDIVNDAAKSKFTLEKMSMGNGQKGAKFFPIETVGTKAADLITYPEREVSADTQKATDADAGTTNLTKGAFYAYPSPKDDHGYLMLKGKYAVNQTESKDVSYQVPFQQMVNGIGTYIEVAYNHRYTITITKADTYHLDVDLKVADWDEKEVIDPYEPENDFDRTEKVVLEAAASTGTYVLDNGQISVLPQDGSKFSFKMGSNTDLTSEVIYKSPTAAKWLVADGEPAVASKAASQETTYNFKVDKAALEAAVTAGQKLEDITIRLSNPASGSRKEIKVIATQGPTVAFVSQEDNYNTFDPAKLIAYIYNVDLQTIKLKVDAETRLTNPADPESTTITGSSATVDESNAWLTASTNVTEASGDYTLTVDGTGEVGNEGTIVFASEASKAKTAVKVILKDPSMTPLTAENFNVDGVDNTVNMTAGSGSIPQVSLTGRLNNSVKITVTSPGGVTAEKTDGDWLTVEAGKSTKTADGKMMQTVITAKITDATGMADAAKTDGAFTITNSLDKKTQKIEVRTSVPKGPELSMKKIEGNLNDMGPYSGTIFNSIGQTITIITSEPSSIVDTKNADNFDYPTEKAKEHTITVKSLADDPDNTSPEFTFLGDGGGKSKIKFSMLVPRVYNAGVEDAPKNITYKPVYDTEQPAKIIDITITDPTEDDTFTLKATSNAGAIVDTEKTSDWLTVEKTSETIDISQSIPGKTVFTVGIKADTDLSTPTDGLIVLKSTIEGGEERTIGVVTKITAEPTPDPAPDADPDTGSGTGTDPETEPAM